MRSNTGGEAIPSNPMPAAAPSLLAGAGFDRSSRHKRRRTAQQLALVNLGELAIAHNPSSATIDMTHSSLRHCVHDICGECRHRLQREVERVQNHEVGLVTLSKPANRQVQ